MNQREFGAQERKRKKKKDESSGGVQHPYDANEVETKKQKERRDNDCLCTQQHVTQLQASSEQLRTILQHHIKPFPVLSHFTRHNAATPRWFVLQMHTPMVTKRNSSKL